LEKNSAFVSFIKNKFFYDALSHEHKIRCYTVIPVVEVVPVIHLSMSYSQKYLEFSENTLLHHVIEGNGLILLCLQHKQKAEV
jgi:hypothetical protein